MDGGRVSPNPEEDIESFLNRAKPSVLKANEVSWIQVNNEVDLVSSGSWAEDIERFSRRGNEILGRAELAIRTKKSTKAAAGREAQRDILIEAKSCR